MTKVGVLSFTFAFAGGIIYTGGKGVWEIGKAMINSFFVGANRDVRTKTVGTGVLDGPKKTIIFPKFSGYSRCLHKICRDRRPRRSYYKQLQRYLVLPPKTNDPQKSPLDR